MATVASERSHKSKPDVTISTKRGQSSKSRAL